MLLISWEVKPTRWFAQVLSLWLHLAAALTSRGRNDVRGGRSLSSQHTQRDVILMLQSLMLSGCLLDLLLLVCLHGSWVSHTNIFLEA